MTTEAFLSKLNFDRPLTDRRFVLTGLHTCGDLAPSMLRLFSESERVVGLASVGCCYMKMADDGPSKGAREEEEGGGRGGGVFMSRFLQEELQTSHGYSPSYQARELACHSISAYSVRLRGGWRWVDP